MNTLKAPFMCCVVAIGLTACDSFEETRSVDYYKAHQAERQAKLKECASNPGEKRKTPNCVNATTAQVQLALSNDK